MLNEHRKPGELPNNIASAAIISAQARQLAKVHTRELSQLDRDFVLLCGSGNTPLAGSVAQLLEKKLYYASLNFDYIPGQTEPEMKGQVPSKEISTSDRRVIIIQSPGRMVNTELMELLMMIDAVKRTGSAKIDVVIPHFPYARQDRKDVSGTSISAKLVADVLQIAGANRVITCDLHADQETGFFNIPVDNLYGSRVLLPYLIERQKDRGRKYKSASPDAGGVKRARAFAKRMHDGSAEPDEEEDTEDIAIFFKERDALQGGRSKVVGVQGNIEGKDVLLIDDMYSGGRTSDECAQVAKDRGAHTVTGVFVHGLFLGRDGLTPLQVLDNSPLDEIVVTDTIEIPVEIRRHPKIKVVSVAPLLAEVIYRNLTGKPIADLVA